MFPTPPPPCSAPAHEHTPPPTKPHQSPDTSRWTGDKAAAFLKQLALHGNAARAARSVRMSRKAAYALRARAPEFARLWDIALADFTTMREVARLRRRAVHPLLDKRPLRPAQRAAPRTGDRRGQEG